MTNFKQTLENAKVANTNYSKIIKQIEIAAAVQKHVVKDLEKFYDRKLTDIEFNRLCLFIETFGSIINPETLAGIMVQAFLPNEDWYGNEIKEARVKLDDLNDTGECDELGDYMIDYINDYSEESDFWCFWL